jgi:hypothetical protein
VSYRLEFETCNVFDPGVEGISVSVRVSAGDVAIEELAKLDTGSSYCVFRREVGEAIGLDIDAGDPVRIATAAGWFEAYAHGVRLEAAGVELEAVVCFARHPGFPMNVLGRHGWIERVRIGLVDYEGLLYVSPFDRDV